MPGNNGNTGGEREREQAESKLITREDLEALGDYLLEILEEEIETREVTFKRKKEGKGYTFYIHVPTEWVKKLGLDTVLEDGSIKIKALIDFKKRAMTVKFP